MRRDAATIRGGRQFDLISRINGRAYRIFVYKPDAPPPPSGYPVVVVTDGNLMFPLAATMAAAFALRDGGTALVVGVGYPTDTAQQIRSLRSRDLTPPTPLSGIDRPPGAPPVKLEDFGGSEAFRRFLVDELRPLIARDYPVDPNDQTLFGHSLGGLFTLGVLFNQPGLFRTFIASSPSIWWNKRAVLKDEPEFARRIAAAEASPRTLIAVGGKEQDVPHTLAPNVTRARARKLAANFRMVDNARELAERLGRVRGAPGYEVAFQAFEEEDHMSVIAAGVSRALAFALKR